MSRDTKVGLLGDCAQVAVERARSEFRAGRLITSGSDAATALPVDGITDAMLMAFRQLSRPVRPFLLVTARRARALGVVASGPTGIALPDFCSADEIFSIASATDVSGQVDFGELDCGVRACAGWNHQLDHVLGELPEAREIPRNP